MRGCLALLGLWLVLLLPTAGAAKPLSYVGGMMLMQENDAGGHTVGIDYTFHPNWALAVHAQRHVPYGAPGGGNFNVIGPQINTLIKRWNLPDGQGNIFGMLGAGTAIDRGDMRGAGWAGFLADYETRRIFLSYELRLMIADKVEKSAWQRARAGWATAPVDLEKTSVWLMVQVDRRDQKHLAAHHTGNAPATEITPLLRLMYRSFLMEAGVSHRGHVMFNWVKQF